MAGSARIGAWLGIVLAVVLAPAGSDGARAPADAMVFGIYPGGAAGTVGPRGKTRPEAPELRRKALLTLRQVDRPFVLHLYDEYRRPADAAALPAWLAAQIAQYTRDGFSIELVLRYRPDHPSGDVAGYVDFVRARVRQLAAIRGVTHLQIANEANVPASPNASDGAYTGVVDALVSGVIAAKAEARVRGRGDLRVGFNWADQVGARERRFFSTLRRRGGQTFSRSVDWVGVDAYPGTWGPKLPRGSLSTAVRKATVRTMRRLRRDLMPRAGVQRARIHFSESGYPTGPGRTAAMQKTVMASVIRTVSAYRQTYGVTDFRWFDLRDADSANPSFESQYGVMRDDYTPKPAYFTYRALLRRSR